MALASRAPTNAEGHGFTCQAPGNAFNDNVDIGLYDAERQLSPRPCPSLFRHKLIWPALYDLKRQVPALLPAHQAGDRDELEWELIHASEYIAATAFAVHQKLPAA